MTIAQWIAHIHDWAERKGWWNDPKPFSSQAANFHSEISEAWEEWRNGHHPNEIYEGESGKPEGIPIELADCVIRIMDTCAFYEIDLEAAIAQKMTYNETRPHRHGGKLA